MWRELIYSRVLRIPKKTSFVCIFFNVDGSILMENDTALIYGNDYFWYYIYTN